MQTNQDAIVNINELPWYKTITLGIQHVFTMFGATVLVPIITGMDISVALFMAGLGTLVFHWITRGKIPAFLGSSFAFIAPILAVSAASGMAYAQGGLVVAGLVYLLLSGLITLFGVEKIIRFFPPVVTGPMIIVIGLKLAPTAIDMASTDWPLAMVAFAIVTVVSVFGRGFVRVIPVIIGMVGGYLAALLMGGIDFTLVREARLIGLPGFTAARFSLEAVIMVAPIALATMVEHIGDVIAIGATVEKDFLKDPGLNKTLIGDGIATSISAFFGGPANTTYSENTGVLALTRAWDPRIMQLAAVFAMGLSMSPKLGALIQTIPTAVIGGISIILFGMIGSIGAKSLIENQVDFNLSRNLIIAAAIMVLGLGGAVMPLSIGTLDLEIAGMALAAVAGIFLNMVLPDN